VQLAKDANLQVFATAGPADMEYVRGLGADRVVNYTTTKFEVAVPAVDAVLDTVGGDTRDRSFRLMKPGGILVSTVSPVPEVPPHPGVRSAFFLVEVTTDRLNTLTQLFDSGKLASQVGSVLPLVAVRTAHEMLAGAPHKRGKIVLQIADTAP
jgi:NADPH:quinone reductase-like Zn-dependent oxidoreductase